MINKDLLIEQIRVALKDEFVASVWRNGDSINLEFASGDVFSVEVKRNFGF